MSTFEYNQFLPDEYRSAALTLFPGKGGFTGDMAPSQAFAAFVELLGISAEYRRILPLQDDELDFTKFIASFYRNLELLIDKTWIEKSDEMRKEMLHARLPAFFSEMESRNYEKALDEFAAVLDELAFLLFGEQSRKQDFVEYTFRIDDQMGLFWWYGGALRPLKRELQPDYQRALLLIGLCFLSNF